MPLKIGYLLPTREQIMAGQPETRGMLELATRAEALGFDAIWVGDSLTARPRHEPLSLLAAVAARVSRVDLGTAVLLPALRNPVLLAHQAATIDQISEGRLILGVGIARDVPSIRAEFTAAGVPFERRVGRMIEGLTLARALWRGEPIDHEGFWSLKAQAIGPTPFRPGGPPLWIAGSLPQSLERAGKFFDGWLPNYGQPEQWGRQWQEVQAIASANGRDPGKLTGAMYLTLSVDEDVAAANARLDSYLEQYYSVPAAGLRKRQECFAGPPSAVAEYLSGYARAGASHLVLRFAGEHARHLETVAKVRGAIS